MSVKRIHPDNWVPADGLELEPNAMTVVKSSENYLVVAGPGAGKTELLAQRASFLLQTNQCKYPHRILAISFKRDAAFNLKNRVTQRCGTELSQRFESLTFDAFAKQIVDRFGKGLPIEFQIPQDYDVLLNESPIHELYRAEDINYYSTHQRNEILNWHTSDQLSFAATSNEGRLRANVWNRLLKSPNARLSFRMISRLAELIINSNPLLKEYLQRTYHYVFLDEFQDTTDLQYDLFKSCFLGSKSCYTAVGDDKQRIMVWAGARATVFNDYKTDARAKELPLEMNFRSAPKLIELQNYLVEALLGKTEKSIPSTKWPEGHGECHFWVFKDPENEKKVLLKEVKGWIDSGTEPRDICILVKQQLGKYAGEIIEYFRQHGVKARDESQFQSILTEEISIYIISTLRLVFKKKDVDAKQSAISFLNAIHTEFKDEQLLILESLYHKFLSSLRKEFAFTTITDVLAEKLVDKIIAHAGIERIKGTFIYYKKGTYLNEIIKSLKDELKSQILFGGDMIETLNALVGIDTIPVMTIHKSKGLEYQTVIFLGLEDSAFWNYSNQPDEDKRSFFVALSRAKERVVITFSKKREGRYGKQENQTLSSIQEVYAVLNSSGLVEMNSRENG